MLVYRILVVCAVLVAGAVGAQASVINLSFTSGPLRYDLDVNSLPEAVQAQAAAQAEYRFDDQLYWLDVFASEEQLGVSLSNGRVSIQTQTNAGSFFIGTDANNLSGSYTAFSDPAFNSIDWKNPVGGIEISTSFPMGASGHGQSHSLEINFDENSLITSWYYSFYADYIQISAGGKNGLGSVWYQRLDLEHMFFGIDAQGNYIEELVDHIVVSESTRYFATTSVPLPAAGGLMGAGLFALGGMRARRRRSADKV